MSRLILSLLPWMFLLSPLVAQTEIRGDLKRRAHLGIFLELDEDQNVVIKQLFPGGTAEKAGAAPGDVLLAIDGESIKGMPALGEAMKGRRAGDRATVKLRREDTEIEKEFVFEARPPEASEEFGILYDVVDGPGGKLRSITTRPKKEGKHPAMLFIQGLQVNSIERFPGKSDNVLELIHGLTKAGFVVMRCEKSGMGDSTGPHASEVGFRSETEGFRKAFEKLKTYDFVDASRVYVFGHSMGGVMAPLVAPGQESAGIIVFGTGVRPWAEYLITNSRYQMRFSGTPYGEIDARLRKHARFYTLALTEKWSIEKIEKERPELAETARALYPDGQHHATRHLKFFQELQDVNAPAAWAAVTSPVLAIRGEFDWVCSEDDHRYIAEIVNATKAGNGRFLSLPKTFHGFDLHEDLASTKTRPFRGPFATALLETTVSFCTGKDG